MKVTVEAPQFDPDVKLIEFIQKKLNKLEQFYDKIIHADVFLKLEPNNKPENKIVEVLISVPGDEFIVKKSAKSFEEGIDVCVQSLERVLKKRKEKLRAHIA
ncbi:ribosome-associated translation inhibitor RaiA [uncultured Dokdonia sp.]|uniref:ribosome hibernation-promoting factor, HPF/YfiA family n=1 Tax=uncultured Dokdonia sp. TaxID=575653 RepID=UPI002625FE01|nr:ribosome-associated translation inhibitor RaiA [uncultured Dokdonia sp.]